MPVPYSVPEVEDNNDGWGPSAVPERLKDVPFAPFSKGDKIGRAADWNASAYQKYPGRYNQNQSAAPAVFNFFANEEEESFHLVDNRPVKPTNRFGGRRFQGGRFQHGRGRGDDRNRDDRGGRGGRHPPHQRRPPWQNNWNRGMERQTNYVPSIEVRPEWELVEQIPNASLTKLSCSVADGEDVVRCGELEYYDKIYDRLAIKAETRLQRTTRAFRNVSSSDDPVMRKLAESASARVFTTDSVITTLMCVRSSVYGWDIVATRRGDQLFLDQREGSNLNLLTVNETAPEPNEEKDAVNAILPLSLEATAINQNFSQQVLVRGASEHQKVRFEQPNPFADGNEELASCAYRYRKWQLNEQAGVDIVVRCELDAAIQMKGEDQLMSIKALNETDLRTQDWRKKIETQRGAILAFETKNNKNKVAKWTSAALLAGADMLKLGYVSRLSARDSTTHVILGTQVTKPKEFAAQINLSMDHCWGVVRAIVDMLLAQPEGRYLLVKDPNKDLLRLYLVPATAFSANAGDYAEEDEEEQA